MGSRIRNDRFSGDCLCTFFACPPVCEPARACVCVCVCVCVTATLILFTTILSNSFNFFSNVRSKKSNPSPPPSAREHSANKRRNKQAKKRREIAHHFVSICLCVGRLCMLLLLRVCLGAWACVYRHLIIRSNLYSTHFFWTSPTHTQPPFPPTHSPKTILRPLPLFSIFNS